jgi:hypothetical protein
MILILTFKVNTVQEQQEYSLANLRNGNKVVKIMKLIGDFRDH